MSVERPRLSVSAAVEAFQVERRSLQRLLSAGRLDGAAKDERGRWMIPVEALHAAGFAPRQTWLSDATNSATVTRHDATSARQSLENTGRDSATNNATARDSDATDLRQRIAQLEQQLDTEKRLREAAERNADDLRMSLRMIEPDASTERPRRRWWQRR